MSLLPNYNKFFAAGLGTTWARQWEPAPPYEGRKLLLAPPPIRNVTFWHVQVRLQGEMYVDPDLVESYLANPENPPIVRIDLGGAGVGPFSSPGTLPELTILQQADEVEQLEGLSRNTASILKLRLSWKDGGGYVRSIDCDLGAGIDVVTPPAHWVQAQLLLPVPGSEELIPAEFARNPLGFATAVIARADCLPTSLERHFTLRWTDTRFLNRTGEPNPVITTRIPRRRATGRFQATSNQPLGPTFALLNRNLPGRAGTLGRVVIGTFGPSPTASTQTLINDIPNSTNEFQYTLPDGTPAATYTVVQELAF